MVNIRLSKLITLGSLLFCCEMEVTAGSSETTYPIKLATLPVAERSAHLFKVEEVARNLRTPWALAFAPDGRLFFTERSGQVRLIENGRLIPDPLVNFDDVYTQGKLGLLGLALHPDFDSKPWLYVAYCYGGRTRQNLRIVRFTEIEGKLGERTTILDSLPAAPSHAGCRLTFGPDGKLWVTTGDAGQPALAQDLNSLCGKTLRLNDDGTVPHDNPFVAMPDVRPEIWSYGHRNAQGICFQPETAHQFQSEHGPSGFDGPGGGDEINIIKKGGNYGWPAVHHRVGGKGYVDPILEYTPAIAPGSAMFYTGNAFPAYDGNLFVGCLGGKSLLRVVLDGVKPVAQERLLFKEYGRIRDVVQGPEGFIYFTTSERDIEVKKPAPETDRIMRLVPVKH